MRQIQFLAFTLLLMLLAATLSDAQNLRRQGMLGIYPEQISGEESAAAGLDPEIRIKVDRLFPNTTAEAMGLQAGDILLKINGWGIYQFPDMRKSLGKLRAGDGVRVMVWRNKQPVELTGTMKGRPLPPAPHGPLVLQEIPFEGGWLRGFLSLPEGEGPFPTVFFIQGYTCGSVEFTLPWLPIGRILNQFVEKGYAVFRVEKPGVGDCAGTPDCSTIDFDTEVKAFKTAYAHMLGLPEVDKDKTFIYGHSLGGIEAPLVAEEYQPLGVIVYGTGIYSWDDYLQEMFRFQLPLFGEDYATVEQKVMDAKPLLNSYFFDKRHPENIGNTEEEKALFAELMEYRGGDIVMNRHYTFWQTLNAVNLVKAWKHTKSHVLALHGEFDLEAIDADAVKKIAEVVDYYHPGHGTFKLIPGTTHGLLKVNSMQEKVDMVQNNTFPQYAQQHYNENVIDIMHEWMQEILKEIK